MSTSCKSDSSVSFCFFHRLSDLVVTVNLITPVTLCARFVRTLTIKTHKIVKVIHGVVNRVIPRIANHSLAQSTA